MGPKKEIQLPADAIAFRIDQQLTKRDLELVKDELVKYLVTSRADVRMWRATKKDNIDAFLCHLHEASPIWAGLGHIDDIWEEMAIHHLKQTVRNQLNSGQAALVAKMENYRLSQGLPANAEPEDDQIDSTAKSKKASPAKGKQLGKRPKQASANQSIGKPTPSKVAQTSSGEEDAKQAGPAASQPAAQYEPPAFNPTMFSTEQWAVVENELQCQVLWKDIRKRKRELKELHKKWAACHAQSVYHTDPVPEFGGEE